MTLQKELGQDGPLVDRVGYGAMGLEGYYGPTDEENAVATLRHAIATGMMIDSADAYGNGHNELLVARALKDSQEEAFIATKFGIVFAEGESGIEVPRRLVT